MKIFIAIAIILFAFTGCVEIEDNSHKVDEYECFRKGKEIGAKPAWKCIILGCWCDLIVAGDTVKYDYKQ